MNMRLARMKRSRMILSSDRQGGVGDERIPLERGKQCPVRPHAILACCGDVASFQQAANFLASASFLAAPHASPHL